MLTSAKHPRAVALLEKALAEATGAANGSAKPAEGGDMDMKPLKKQKDGSISSAKISNYGKICFTGVVTCMPWAL